MFPAVAFVRRVIAGILWRVAMAVTDCAGVFVEVTAMVAGRLFRAIELSVSHEENCTLAAGKLCTISVDKVVDCLWVTAGK